jgi:hypothetical protein
MQVTVTILEGDVYEIRADIPDTVDTSNWTRIDWERLGWAISRARFDDREQLEQIAGDVEVSDRHLEGDSELQMVEAGPDVVFRSWEHERERALTDALTTVRAWAEGKPGGEAVLHIIDKALWRVTC